MNFERRLAPPADASQDDDAVRKRRFIIRAVIILLIVVIAGVIIMRAVNKPAPVEPALQSVTVIVPGRTSVAGTVSVPGTLAARREMPVGVAGEGGMISRVLVDAGDWVKAGQVLATIDRSVQAQEANQQSAQIAAARADAEIAQSDLARAQALISRGFISKADLDRKIATRDAANARVKLAQAQLSETRARIGRLDIRAPADGLVLTRGAEPGQIVQPGNDPLFRLARAGEMELQARLAESDIARLKVGDSAEVTPVGSSQSFAGRIWQLSPVIDPQTRQGVARIALSYDPALRPGGFASATINSGTIEAPLLYESAIQADAKGNFVYIVDANNVVVRRDVKIGQVSEKGIAIASGLQGNERVVLSAGAFLSPGDKIKPELKAADRPATR